MSGFVAEMKHAKEGTYKLYVLQERYNGRPLPKVEIGGKRRYRRADVEAIIEQ